MVVDYGYVCYIFHNIHCLRYILTKLGLFHMPNVFHSYKLLTTNLAIRKGWYTSLAYTPRIIHTIRTCFVRDTFSFNILINELVQVDQTNDANLTCDQFRYLCACLVLAATALSELIKLLQPCRQKSININFSYVANLIQTHDTEFLRRKQFNV